MRNACQVAGKSETAGQQSAPAEGSGEKPNNQ
jgi:hypothetical protein